MTTLSLMPIFVIVGSSRFFKNVSTKLLNFKIKNHLKITEKPIEYVNKTNKIFKCICLYNTNHKNYKNVGFVFYLYHEPKFASFMETLGCYQ